MKEEETQYVSIYTITKLFRLFKQPKTFHEGIPRKKGLRFITEDKTKP
jgi:hypothetical protein